MDMESVQRFGQFVVVLVNSTLSTDTIRIQELSEIYLA